MRVFLDTNIILDVALDRAPFAEGSSNVLGWCGDSADCTLIAWHTFTNVFYILSRQEGDVRARAFLKDLMSWVRLAPTSEFFLHSSLDRAGDLEDVLQYLCAQAAAADIIVTRDPTGFKPSPVRAVSAEEFLREVK